MAFKKAPSEQNLLVLMIKTFQQDQIVNQKS